MRRICKGRKLLLLSSVLILGLTSILLGGYSGAIGVADLSDLDRSVIKRFHQIYYDSLVWEARTRWLGVRSLQNPADNWIMQEIIAEVKPDFVIETGTRWGGTSLFYASVLALVNEKGKVITVDIDPLVDEAAKYSVFRERVEVIKGDSVSPEVVDAIASRVENRKVLVTLDSLHAKDHVLKEMELYSKFVSPGSYLVVQDTNINGNPVRPDFGEGPMEAVEEFLHANKDFTIDRSREKFLLTFYPSGYLKRIR